MMAESNCGDCRVAPGQLHRLGCDVERCPNCGGQLISCDCSLRKRRTGRMPWTGEWPGVAECREFGWYCRRNPDGPGYVPCGPDHPGAVEDLSRLTLEARWDRELKRFVLPAPAPPEEPRRPACPACGGPTVDRGAAVWCERCRVKVETCCDGGDMRAEGRPGP